MSKQENRDKIKSLGLGIATGVMVRRATRRLGFAQDTSGMAGWTAANVAKYRANEYYAKKRKANGLQHSGVKGMKWGVRKAKGYISNKVNLFRTDRATKRDHANAYKNRANLSDSELRARTQRLRLENDYKQAIQSSKNSNSITSQIIKAAVPVLVASATAGATHYATARISNSPAAKKALNRMASKSKLTKQQLKEVFRAMGQAAKIKAMPKKK